MILYFLFQVLPAAAALIYTLHLAYVISNPSRLKVKMKKIAARYSDKPFRDKYQKLYNKQFFVGWVLVTSWLILSIGSDILEAALGDSYVSLSVGLVSVGCSIAGFYLFYDLFKKK
jgi:hypothetical protein